MKTIVYDIYKNTLFILKNAKKNKDIPSIDTWSLQHLTIPHNHLHLLILK